MHNDVFNLILHSPISFFDCTPIGVITNRMAKDVDEIDNYIPIFAENFLRNVCRVFGAILLICFTVPYYTFAVILEFIVLLLINMAYRKVVRAIKRLENVARSPVYSHIATSLQGIPCIRTLDIAGNFQNKFRELVDKNILADYLFWASSRWFSFYSDMVCVFGVVTMSVIAILLKDKVPAAILGLCITYTIRVSKMFRGCSPEVFVGKGILKIWSKFTGEHPCRSVTSIKLFKVHTLLCLIHMFCLEF